MRDGDGDGIGTDGATRSGDTDGVARGPRLALTIPTIVLVYWGLAATWLVATDLLIGTARGSSTADAAWNVAKGLAFVTITAGLLYALLRRRQRAIDDARRRSAELQERLRDAERMDAVGRLAGGVAHDFNNLLAVVRGHLDLIRLDSVPDQTESIDTIGEVVDRAATLTGELQAVARRQRLDLQAVDLAELVDHHCSALNGLLPPSVHLEVTSPGTAVPVALDPAGFPQVIFNLSTNARDAMPDGGTLHVDVSTRGDDAVLTFTDTGRGMTPDEVRHCFEPFYSTKSAGKGTGLGLALTYGVVRQSGGDIAVRSTVGRGTTVEVTLPLADRRGGVRAPAV